MSVISRNVAAIPVRTSTATWQAITELISRPGSDARIRLNAVTGIAGILIACEYTRLAPIVVMPARGARVRIWTVHGDDAQSALEESPLAFSPCEQPGWTVSLPCGIDDIDEIRAAAKNLPGIEIRDVTDGIAVSAARAVVSEWSIDYDEMERP